MSKLLELLTPYVQRRLRQVPALAASAGRTIAGMMRASDFAAKALDWLTVASGTYVIMYAGDQLAAFIQSLR